jgi:hypothetical protein
MICIDTGVFEEKELSAAAKLFYGYLKNHKEYCDASNQFYANVFHVSTVTINNWLFALEKHKHIQIHYYKKKRLIIIN